MADGSYTGLTPAQLIADASRRVRQTGYSRLHNRLRKGWDRERALSTPLGEPGRPEANVLDGYPELALPYEQDPIAQCVVACCPEGVDLVDIGLVMGLSSERVRQVSHVAAAKLARGLARLGVSESDVIGYLMSSGGEGTVPDATSGRTRQSFRETPAPEVAGSDVEREADDFVTTIRETAAAHRFVESVVCGMENGGETRVLEERFLQEVFSSPSDMSTPSVAHSRAQERAA